MRLSQMNSMFPAQPAFTGGKLRKYRLEVPVELKTLLETLRPGASVNSENARVYRDAYGDFKVMLLKNDQGPDVTLTIESMGKKRRLQLTKAHTTTPYSHDVPLEKAMGLLDQYNWPAVFSGSTPHE